MVVKTSFSKTVGHSADVQMHLTVNGRVLSIGQLAPGFIMLDDPIDLPPTDAEIFMSIDGHERRWTVHLVDGIRANDRETKIGPPR